MRRKLCLWDTFQSIKYHFDRRNIIFKPWSGHKMNNSNNLLVNQQTYKNKIFHPIIWFTIWPRVLLEFHWFDGRILAWRWPMWYQLPLILSQVKKWSWWGPKIVGFTSLVLGIAYFTIPWRFQWAKSKYEIKFHRKFSKCPSTPSRDRIV